ncbi:hypothetical protein [Glaciecola petra]|uniref:Uncharacterized protein n=1 Tax=Glaciecola petra TaxID=3075602 RepID=A0ABU2ZV26_9ALTE|nr:hypothetical protein [Aestuariibacter sp. P117]MDT0596111.1 hypothetical protein [Aestuariibacter sp. P117]
MKVGAIFFDTNFHFHDGESGEKLFVVLGTKNSITVVAKTTSSGYGKNIEYGCQPNDRFHNFYLPVNTCYLKKNTWICLDEFYEVNNNELLQKKFTSVIRHICDLDTCLAKELQNCALISEDISMRQEKLINNSLL